MSPVSSVTLYGPSSPSNPFVFTTGDGSGILNAQYVNTDIGLESTQGTVKITAPAAGVNALFLQFGTASSGMPITITLSDNEMFTATPAGATRSRLWLTLTHPISSLTVTSTGNDAVVTGLSFGASNLTQDPSSTPETATALLVGTGMLLLAVKRRKLLSALAS
jgi:hypothetical protein